MEQQLFELFKQFGPMAGLVIFFIYRDQQRETRLGLRLDAMQDRYATTMETIVKDNTKAMEAMAEAAKATSNALSENTKAVNQLTMVCTNLSNRQAA